MLSIMAFTMAFGASAQHSIRGKITNEAGGVISGAKISLENTYNSAYSNGNGEYDILDVKDDSVHLTITYVGFESVRISLLVQGKDVEQNAVMIMSSMMMEEVQIVAIRANEKTPTTYTNLNEKEIQKGNFGQDLPYLLQATPSTVVTSDAGAGVGYTGIRIRGVDPTRTNITVNGIPMNDAESHGVYWVNMPDFASSSDNIQVQRGVGTSTNGAASFGASINVKTDNIRKESYAEIDNSGGSFNTLRNTVKLGTGLINNKFVVDARLSRISSEGYVDRASSDLKSYYLSGAWIGTKSILKANVFSGMEKTYQAWYGVPEAKLKGNVDSLTNHFYNNYYPGGIYETSNDSISLFNSDPRKYNYYSYNNETDNYKQDHYQLHFSHAFNSKTTLNLAGHYAHGEGYYEQYKRDQSFGTYGLDTVFTNGDTITTTDLIRRRWLDNDFYGAIFSLSYNNLKNFKILVGGGANQYNGKHFGEIIWARSASSSEINQPYYNNIGHKTEVNGYVKLNYQVKKLNAFADLQLRNIMYDYNGKDQYFSNLVALKEDVAFTFFNPKVGLMYDFNNKNNLYASFSVANREPVRDDFVQSSATNRPRPEQLQNTELGYRYHARKVFVNANYYLMNYIDQLILTGEINDVGAYNRVNVAKSYRSGIELEGGYMVFKNVSLTGNFTFSANKIKEFNEFVDNYDNYDAAGNMIQDVIKHVNTDIAFSPSTIASLSVMYNPIKSVELMLQSKYVGKQYLDNTSNELKQLNAYYTSNLTVNYTLIKWGFKEIKVGALVNNLFNYLYENNGYTWGYIAGGKRITENFYYPQAGRNFLLRLTLKM